MFGPLTGMRLPRESGWWLQATGSRGVCSFEMYLYSIFRYVWLNWMGYRPHVRNACGLHV